MKKPDEIKTAMECCVIGPSANQPKCGECPYMYEKNCSDTFLKDALALTQQLEADKQQLEGLLAHMNQLRDAAAGRALKMEERVHQLEAERDALIKYITDSSWAACDICKHGIDGASAMNCKHIREVGVPCFEWRGVQKEDGNA